MKGIIKIIPWVIFLVMLAVLLKLGFWQVFRAEEKQQLLDVRAKYELADPATVEQLLSEEDVQFRPLLLQGKWSQQWSFYQDNRIQDGVVGYNLFSLFVDNSGYGVFVDRGWAGIDNERNFKFVPPRENQIQVLGYAYQPSLYKVLTLPLPKQNDVIPLPGLHIDQLVSFFKEQNIKLVPFVLRQTFPETEEGLLREWYVVAMPPERHFGYAVQWFSLALALFVIVMIIIWKKFGKEKIN